MKKINNQKQQPTPVVEMDAGKFLHMINVGAQSQVSLFSERISKMGEAVGKNWRLTSLDGAALVFEDVNTNSYFMADIKRLPGSKVKIENIRGLRIIESDRKGASFKKNCLDLVEAISEDKNDKADVVFNRITAQRFRSSVIPESGVLTTRDGITRKISVTNTIASEDIQMRICDALTEAMTESVKVQRGRIVEGVFGQTKMVFPVDELTRRKVVARHMKMVAMEAYKHDGFQNRVKHIAALVSEEKVEDAVRIAADFLKEDQEFSLLTISEMRELTGFALAAVGCMNKDLADDVGKLLYRTNCKINKDTIVAEWRETAKMSESAPLVENVRTLAESSNFEGDYNAFLKTVFVEDASTKAGKSAVYLSALETMRTILSGKEDTDPELVTSLDNYITRLKEAGNEVDDSTLFEIDKFFSLYSEKLANGMQADMQSISDFDKLPTDSEPKMGQFGADLGDEAGDESGMGGGGGPSLPLGGGDLGGEDLGGEDLGGEAGEDLGGEGDNLGEEGGEDLGAELAGEEDELGGDEEIALPESKDNAGKTITESKCSKCDKQKCTCEDGKCACEGPTCECTTECNMEDVRSLDSNALRLEMNEWSKNGAKYFAEDGVEQCKTHIGACIARATELKESNIVAGFKEVLAENTPIEGEVEVESDPYAYEAQDVKIKPYVNECLSKVSSKGRAMGKAGEADANVAKDAGVSGAILKKKGGKICSDKVTCMECNGTFETVNCMTESGALCPDCKCDMTEQIMEALAIDENIKGAGHKMDSIGGEGVVKKTVTASDGKSGHKAQSGAPEGDPKMDTLGGKGVIGTKVTDSDGAKAGGKKEGMEQEGKGVAEDQYKKGTKRHGLNFPNKGRGTVAQTESKKVNGSELAEDAGIIAAPAPNEPSVAKTTVTVSGNSDEEGRHESHTVTIDTDEPVDEVVAKISQAMGEIEEIEENGVTGDVEQKDIEAALADAEAEGETVEHELSETPEEEAAEHAPGGEHAEGAEGAEDAEVEADIASIEAEGAEEKAEEAEEEAEDAEEDAEEAEEDAEGKPFGKTVKEDNDMTEPTSKKYTNDEAARKDGDGKQMNEKPKFSDKDYDGTKPAKTAK